MIEKVPLRRIVVLLTALVMSLPALQAPAAQAAPAISGLRITLNPLPKSIKEGASLRMSGRLEGKTDAGWVGLPETYLSVGGATGWSLSHPTDANGDFDTAYTLYAPSKVSAQASVQGFTAKTPEQIVRFNGSPLPYDARVSFKSIGYADRWGNRVAGTVGVSTPETSTPLTGSIVLYSSRDGMNWSAHKTFTARRSVKFSVRTGSARHWYLRYGDPTGTFFDVPETPIVHLPAKTTSFRKVKLSKKSARFNSKVTVSGVFSLPRRSLQLGFHCKSDKNNKWYVDFGKVKTDAKGRFKKTVRVKCTGGVFAYFPGADKYFASTGGSVPLKVTNTPKGWSTRKLHRGPSLAS